MKKFYALTIVSAVALGFSLQPAQADNTDAHCTLYQGGNQVNSGTGRCEFSQRQGYVDITLQNGKNYSLSPADGGGFTDRQGKQVSLQQGKNNRTIYKWPRQQIIVNFSDAAISGGGHQGGSGSGASGLQYIVGMVGGEGEDQLIERGYRLANYNKAGVDVYSNFWNESSNSCVTVWTSDSLYRSIADAPEMDCKR